MAGKTSTKSAAASISPVELKHADGRTRTAYSQRDLVQAEFDGFAAVKPKDAAALETATSTAVNDGKPAPTVDGTTTRGTRPR